MNYFNIKYPNSMPIWSPSKILKERSLYDVKCQVLNCCLKRLAETRVCLQTMFHNILDGSRHTFVGPTILVGPRFEAQCSSTTFQLIKRTNMCGECAVQKKPKERHCADYLVVAQAQCGQKITPFASIDWRRRFYKNNIQGRKALFP